VRINFISPPLRSSGNVRRTLARQLLVLTVSVVASVLIRNLVTRSQQMGSATIGSFTELSGDSVSRCRKELETLQQSVNLLRSAKDSRTEPDRVMAAVGRSVPDGVWILSIRDRARHVEIDGRALSDGDVRKFMARLEKEEALERVGLVSSQLLQHEVGSLEFRVVADYQPPH